MRGPVIGAFCRIGLAVLGGGFLADAMGLGLRGQFLGVALGITAYGAVIAASVRPEIWRAKAV